MKRAKRRKCLCCGKLYRPDRRNLRHQRHCYEPACRKASKARSQRRWLVKAENRDYFRGTPNVVRVRAWRVAHPGYWRRPGSPVADALQEDLATQGVETQRHLSPLAHAALQEVLCAQPTVLIGLIAHLTDSALQEDIAKTSRRLLQLGQDILGGRSRGADQTSPHPRASAPGAGAVQLGRPSTGA